MVFLWFPPFHRYFWERVTAEISASRSAGVPHALPGPAALALGARLQGGVAAGLRQVRAAGDRGDAFGTGDGEMDLEDLEDDGYGSYIII